MPKPESLKSNLKSEVVKQVPHSETQRLQVTGCTAEKYCLLHVVVQGSESFRDQLNVFVRRTVTELRGVKVAQFFDFGLFSNTKKPKMYLPVSSIQPRGYIAE